MSRRTRLARRLRTAAAIAAVLGWAWVIAPPAGASWPAAAGGAGRATVATMPAGNQPVATFEGGVVLVSWGASTGAAPVDGYRVEAYTDGAPRPVGGTCAGDADGVVVATSCTDDAPPPGSSTYTVTPVRRGWSGDASVESEPVNVD